MTAYKYIAPAGASPADTRVDLRTEFVRWNAQAGSQIVSDYDLPMKKGAESSATVAFLLRGRTIRVSVDKWEWFETNLRCVYLIIRDMRLAEARGALDSLREALLQLPAADSAPDPFEILGVSQTRTRGHRGRISRPSQAKHPDLGGNDDEMRELNDAREAALLRVSGKP